MIIVELLLGFLKVGLFTFGGGYAAIPLIREVVLSHGWLTEENLTYMIAVSESTPGPIMVNMATYVGSSQAGILGAVAATFAVVLPSFVILQLILLLLKNLIRNPGVQALLAGMQAAVVGIILATGISMAAKACLADGAVDLRACFIGAVMLVLAFGGKKLTGRKISPIALITLSGVLGVICYGI